MRKIIHLDMDAFYAAVEARDRPQLRGVALVVGGSPRSRSVVCAASYEARAYGVRSAMPCAEAARRCPQAVFVPPDFRRYQAESARIHGILRECTDLIEPLSLDEAYLDVTGNRWDEPSATRVAQRLRQRIRAETGLAASAGVAACKFLAKVACERAKPDGLAVIAPGGEQAVLRDLPVSAVPGIGPVTARRLAGAGIRVVGDFWGFPAAELVARFGDAGAWYHEIAHGRDPRPVVAGHERRSVGIEDTFDRDLTDRDELRSRLAALADGLAQRLDAAGVRGRTLTLKVKYHDFRVITRRRTLPSPPAGGDAILALADDLAEGVVRAAPVRLLGLSVAHLLAGESPAQERIDFAAGPAPVHTTVVSQSA